MITDIDLQLATAISPTTVGTTNPPVYLDTLINSDWGMGSDWIWYVDVATAFSTASSPTLQLQLQGNPADATFTSGNVTILDTGVVAAATLVKGYEFKLKYPRGYLARYLRVNIIVGTANFSTGTFSSWLHIDAVQDVFPNNIFAAGYTVK